MKISVILIDSQVTGTANAMLVAYIRNWRNY